MVLVALSSTAKRLRAKNTAEAPSPRLASCMTRAVKMKECHQRPVMWTRVLGQVRRRMTITQTQGSSPLPPVLLHCKQLR
jgi:hypothetical protein